MAFREKKKHYNDMICKAEDALSLYESKASGLSADEVKYILKDLHNRLIDIEIVNDDIKRAQHELERSHNKYARLFDSLPVGLLAIDAEGSIMEANLAFANLIGMERRKLIRVNLDSLIYAQDRALFRNFIGALCVSDHDAKCKIRILKESLICHVYISGVRLDSTREIKDEFLLTVSNSAE